MSWCLTLDLYMRRSHGTCLGPVRTRATGTGQGGQGGGQGGALNEAGWATSAPTALYSLYAACCSDLEGDEEIATTL